MLSSSISPEEDSSDMNQTLECRDPVPAIRLTTGILLMVRSNVMMSVLEDVECL